MRRNRSSSTTKLHRKGVCPEALGREEVTEHNFSPSPYDPVHNMKGGRRSRRARKMARLGYPYMKNDSGNLVLPKTVPPWPYDYNSTSLIHRMSDEFLTHPLFRGFYGRMIRRSTKYSCRQQRTNFHTWLKRSRYGPP